MCGRFVWFHPSETGKITMETNSENRVLIDKVRRCLNSARGEIETSGHAWKLPGDAIDTINAIELDDQDENQIMRAWHILVKAVDNGKITVGPTLSAELQEANKLYAAAMGQFEPPRLVGDEEPE